MKWHDNADADGDGRPRIGFGRFWSKQTKQVFNIMMHMVDYAWVSTGLLTAWEVVRCAHEAETLAEGLSDHALVVCELRRRAGTPAEEETPPRARAPRQEGEPTGSAPLSRPRATAIRSPAAAAEASAARATSSQRSPAAAKVASSVATE